MSTLGSPLVLQKVTVFPPLHGVVQRELSRVVERWDLLTLRRGGWGPHTRLMVLRAARGVCGRNVGTTFPLFLYLRLLDLNKSIGVLGLRLVFRDVLSRPLRFCCDLLVEGVLLLLGVVAYILIQDDTAGRDLTG